jgi:hypothetical protein
MPAKIKPGKLPLACCYGSYLGNPFSNPRFAYFIEGASHTPESRRELHAHPSRKSISEVDRPHDVSSFVW